MCPASPMMGKKVRKRKLEEIDCWNCGEIGHFRYQCSQKSRPSSGDDRSADVNKFQENKAKLN